MANTPERPVVDEVVGELEAADGAKAPADTVSIHGGSGTIVGTHYAPGTILLGGGAGAFGDLNGGTDTRPLSAGFSVGSLELDEPRVRPSKMEIQAERRRTEESLRAFVTGTVEPVGRVPGIEHLQKRTSE